MAIVLDETAIGGEFDALRAEIFAAKGQRPLIEIFRRRPGEPIVPMAGELPKVARDEVVPDIAATLLFELAKAG